ncbi:MAG: LacI family DNA-binding transcriptional regulator [Caldilineaceae bacterium]
MNKKRVSIKDIAELAGVSHPTVSRAAWRRPDERRHAGAILTIAADIGYTPSLIARGLVTQRSHWSGWR